MTRRQRLRRTALLCLHCLRNLAFFRGVQEVAPYWSGEPFWISANNNFLDIGLLEWCKVFGDLNAKHHWRKSVTDEAAFYAELLDHIRLTQEFFDHEIKAIRKYRDKFIAHLDEDEQMDIPNLSPVVKSAQFLYRHLLGNENDCNAFPDLPGSAIVYFRESIAIARAQLPMGARQAGRRS